MGYGRALLQRDVRREESDLQKKVTKKSLWGSIGRTLGGLGAMALTGGAAAPWAAALMAGGGTLLGGAIGARAAGGKLTGGTFMQEDRKSLQKELGALGSRNITESLKSGLTAGIGQKLKLMKSGETAAKGLDFQDSFAGKGLQKVKTARLGKEFADKGWIDPNLQNQFTGATGQKISTIHEGGAPIVAMDRHSNIAKQFKSPLTREAGGVSLQNPNLLDNVTAPSIAGGERGRDAAETLRIQAQQQEQLDLMSKGKSPGLFMQTREGGAPILQDESLDAILQRQSGTASAADKSTSMISYSGGGTGIDSSIKSTGNEFIDRQLGGHVERPVASIYPDTRYGEYRKRLLEADTPTNTKWQQTLFSGE